MMETKKTLLSLQDETMEIIDLLNYHFEASTSLIRVSQEENIPIIDGVASGYSALNDMIIQKLYSHVDNLAELNRETKE